MRLIDRFLGLPEEPAPRTVFAPEATPSRSTAEKIDFHIERFTRALEQCEKGPARAAELQAHLDYWLAIKAANEAIAGA